MSSDANPPAPSGIPAPGAPVEKIDVDALRARDRIEIVTVEGAVYSVFVGKHLHAILTSSNKQARALQVILCGGTDSESSEYTPNRIFSGGRLAYTFEKDTNSILTTPVIQSMTYIRRPE